MKTCLGVPLAGLGSITELLPYARIPAKRVGELLGTSPGHLRVIRWRAKRPVQQSFSHALVTAALLRPPSDKMRRCLGVRPHQGPMLLPDGQTEELEKLQEQIEEIGRGPLKKQHNIEGVTLLAGCKPSIGFPASALGIRLKARIHELTGWFFVHNGLTHSALDELVCAVYVSAAAHHESGDLIDRNRMIEALRFASHACLLQHQPEEALAVLKLIEQASEAAGLRRGSDYYRQLGVAYFQLGADDRAMWNFDYAGLVMESLGEAEHPLQIQMTGSRQTALIRPDWDRAEKLINDARQVYGADSLEFSMAVHWGAACGLLVDSPGINDQALGYLEENRANAQRFGHQATVSALLRMTLDLKFPPSIRGLWIRKALYENSFHNN